MKKTQAVLRKIKKIKGEAKSNRQGIIEKNSKRDKVTDRIRYY